MVTGGRELSRVQYVNRIKIVKRDFYCDLNFQPVVTYGIDKFELCRVIPNPSQYFGHGL